jgi:hypothetical protein
MPQCGLAPGFIGIVGNDLARRFDDAAQPAHARGRAATLPPGCAALQPDVEHRGLINEYCNPCEAIVDGAKTTVPALEGLETFALDGVEYEAFNTSGGLGTLTETLAGRARQVDYKSIRYPGHCAILKLLLNDLRLRERRDLAQRDARGRHSHHRAGRDRGVCQQHRSCRAAGWCRIRIPRASWAARWRATASAPSSSPRRRAFAPHWTWWPRASLPQKGLCGAGTGGAGRLSGQPLWQRVRHAARNLRRGLRGVSYMPSDLSRSSVSLGAAGEAGAAGAAWAPNSCACAIRASGSGASWGAKS